MDYKQTLDWLFSRLPMFSRVGAAAYKPGLETVQALAKHFDNPERRFKSIHIAGTNGKGSCSHMLAAALQAQGYKTGLYTSPHLVDFRERMRINGKMIPKEEVVEFVRNFQVQNYQGTPPSFFELTMMMAFDWFAREQVDYAVIEVGMGGRLDSTNIIIPELSIITNISPDHTQFLGDTLEKIATEKAGIIKPNIPVVIGEALDNPGVKQVFQEKAERENAPITFAEEYTRPLQLTRNQQGRWTLHTPHGEMECALSGEYQQHNIRTVYTAIDALRQLGIEISPAAETEGLRDVEKLTGLQGRWTVLQRAPLTICDTGHNVAGLAHNLEQLQQTPHRKLYMVIGFVSDKDIDHIIDMLPREAEYAVTQAQIPRAMPVDQLSDKFTAAGLKHESFATVAEAYRHVLDIATPEDLIYIGGSTFIVADLLALPN